MKWCARHPGLLAAVLILGVGFMGAYPLQTLTIAAACGCFYALWRWFVWLDRRSHDIIKRGQMLAWDADYEHWMTMQGHPVGTYGRYSPWV